MLARANNRAISLAALGKRVGATTVECCGQRIMITCGMSGGLSSSTTMRSLPLILPAASARLGHDVVTAGSIPSRARFGVRISWRARLIGSRKPGLEVIAKVRLAQCLQSDPALQIPPHPLPAERLDLPHQPRRATRMDPTPLDRPTSTPPHQHPHPTPQHPTPTPQPQPTTTNARRSSVIASQMITDAAYLQAARVRAGHQPTHQVPDIAAVPAPRPTQRRRAGGVKIERRASGIAAAARRNDLDAAEQGPQSRPQERPPAT